MVTRYEACAIYTDLNEDCQIDVDMREYEFGDFVEYSDYAEMEKAYEELKQKIYDLYRGTL